MMTPTESQQQEIQDSENERTSGSRHPFRDYVSKIIGVIKITLLLILPFIILPIVFGVISWRSVKFMDGPNFMGKFVLFGIAVTILSRVVSFLLDGFPMSWAAAVMIVSVAGCRFLAGLLAGGTQWSDLFGLTVFGLILQFAGTGSGGGGGFGGCGGGCGSGCGGCGG